MHLMLWRFSLLQNCKQGFACMLLEERHGFQICLRTMHHYLTGVAKPAVKRKLQKREQDTLYYQQKWQHGYLKVWERDHT